MQKSDSDLASVIVLRAVVRDDERLFVPLRSQFIAHLCQAPLFQVCGGKVTARSQSFTTKQNQLRQTFPSASSDYNPRMIRILVCLWETNRAAGCFHKHARAESREGFITVQATTAYHIKKGSHSSKHPLFLWSVDTIGGVWRALSSDLSLKDVSRPPSSGRASFSVRLTALFTRGSIRLIKIRQTQLITAALLHYYQLPNIYSLSCQCCCTREESSDSLVRSTTSITPAQIQLLLLLSMTHVHELQLFSYLWRDYTLMMRLSTLISISHCSGCRIKVSQREPAAAGSS